MASRQQGGKTSVFPEAPAINELQNAALGPPQHVIPTAPPHAIEQTHVLQLQW